MVVKAEAASRRIRRWLSSRTGLSAVLWSVNIAACRISFIVNRRQSGQDSAIRYIGNAIALAISLTATVRFPGPMLLAFPMLAAFSVSSPPAIGYGGQIVMFAFWTTVTLTLAAVALSYRTMKRPSDRLKGQAKWLESAGNHAVATTAAERVYIVTVPPGNTQHAVACVAY